ncbi:MAG: hypothetical protein R3330_05005, partial [Saprospiraceae bacterium]|nr:hypothetical protein [Saprospiraceae bacterium]
MPQMLMIAALLLFAVISCPAQTRESPSIASCACSDWPNWEDRDGVTCHYLTVPEDHDNPDGTSIRIAFAIFRGTGQNTGNIPTVILTGGPGGRALGGIDWWFDDDLRALGDLIVVEQRGIGLSSPLPDVGQRTFEILAADLTSEEEKAQTRALMQENAREIKAAGIDVTKYNSSQNARDFGVLMHTL